MKNSSFKTSIALAVIILGFAAVFGLSNYLGKVRPVLPEGYEDQDLSWQGGRMKGYTLGLDGLVADWYWIQALHYIGDKFLENPDAKVSIDNLAALNPHLLYPYLDNATTLDPKFLSPYYYGAIVLPAIDPEQAVKITEKGIANNPNEWRLYQQLGYIYWRLGNYDEASETYGKGSNVVDAPPFMEMMAARMKTQGGSRDTARTIYTQLLDESQNASTKEIIELRLLEIDSLDEQDIIRKILKEFQSKNTRCINNWSELFPLLKTVKPPNNKDFRIDNLNNIVDPSGAPYLLDKTNCDVKLDFAKTKIPISQ